METSNSVIIGEAYKKYLFALRTYVNIRIKDHEDAEDIVQDVFVRLLGFDVISEETIKSLCYTIASNLVVDYIRRHYKREEIYSYLCDSRENDYVLTPEQIAVFHDLAAKERCLMYSLSPATQRVYQMGRMEGRSIDEISDELNISRRTVESHQFRARKIIREGFRKIV